MIEIRHRKRNFYVNDLASYTKKVPEAVFAFTLEELRALEAWVPDTDGFHKEVDDAIAELLRLELPDET